VAGSHPGAASNPWGQQLPLAVQRLSPDVISFTNDEEYVYRAGFTHPTGPLPAAIRAAFMFEKNPATAGAEADVPDIL
jgi:hypothetical protein